MRAQGTIEYLVILAVIVVISLVVVSLMASSTAPASQISETQSKLYWETQPISITNASADRNGDAIMMLTPKETVTVDKITINGEEKEFDATKIAGGNSATLLLSGMIPCDGTTTTYTINGISAVNENGFPVPIPEAALVVICSEDISESSSASGDYITPVSGPEVILLSPGNGATISSVDFNFSVTSGTPVASCDFIVDSATVETITGPQAGSTITLYLPDGTTGGTPLSPQPTTWNVSCTNEGGTGTGTERTFNNPYSIVRHHSSCGTLSTQYSYHILTQDLSAASCFTLADNNITIDGNGFSLTGTGTAVSGESANQDAKIGTIIKNLAMAGDIMLGGGESSSLTGYSGGDITLINSSADTINTGAGLLNPSGAGASQGMSGNIYLENSSANTIIAYPAPMISAGSGAYTTGNGGSVTAINSTITEVNNGGTVLMCQNTCALVAGNGGNVNATDSDIDEINSRGGNCQPFMGNCGTPVGGDGGDVTFNPCPDPKPIVINPGGEVVGGSKFGADGTITPSDCHT